VWGAKSAKRAWEHTTYRTKHAEVRNRARAATDTPHKVTNIVTCDKKRHMPPHIRCMPMVYVLRGAPLRLLSRLSCQYVPIFHSFPWRHLLLAASIYNQHCSVLPVDCLSSYFARPVRAYALRNLTVWKRPMVRSDICCIRADFAVSIPCDS